MLWLEWKRWEVLSFWIGMLPRMEEVGGPEFWFVLGMKWL